MRRILAGAERPGRASAGQRGRSDGARANTGPAASAATAAATRTGARAGHEQVRDERRSLHEHRRDAGVQTLRAIL